MDSVVREGGGEGGEGTGWHPEGHRVVQISHVSFTFKLPVLSNKTGPSLRLASWGGGGGGGAAKGSKARGGKGVRGRTHITCPTVKVPVLSNSTRSSCAAV